MSPAKRQARARSRVKTMSLARTGVPFTRSAFTYEKPARKVPASVKAAIERKASPLDRILGKAEALARVS